MPEQSRYARVYMTQDGGEEQMVEFTDLLTMGRSRQNKLIINDSNASRSHAEVRLVSNTNSYRLFDVGSANGTWLNGRRVTTPRDLNDGDQIVVGNAVIRFVGPDVDHIEEEQTATGMYATNVTLRNETVIAFVSDIRNYTGMSEELPVREFTAFVSEWFKQATEIVEANGGTVDKLIGDAIMIYWVAKTPKEPAPEVNNALKSAREMMARSIEYSEQITRLFPGQTFRIGIGINIGDAIFGNVGTADNQSFTVVGDSVNVAFRLESLCKEMGKPVIISQAVKKWASGEHEFANLGKAEVKGKKEPIDIWSLEVPEAPAS